MAWFLETIHAFLDNLVRLFTTPIFEIGGSRFSLQSIIVSLLLAVLVFLLSRAVSEWTKRRLLRRLDRGLRETVAAVMSYVLTAFGLLIVLQSAGVNLSSLTVIAGVLGIGFGFGLQNLASNFISGLTLLFEQPIKVGDYIEVEDLLGTVEKISIRSTVVRTPDDVFVIVPNLDLVQKHIVNWSYHAPQCRLHIPVGVAYGSDAVVVTEALLAAARQESHVLHDPAPRVWFKEFGESSLNFELLVWINDPPESDPIRSALNFFIEQELRHRGVAIPFPHRDLYLRNVDELKGILQPPTGSQPSANGATSNRLAASATSGTPKPISNWALRDLLRRVSYFERCTNLELRKLIEYGYRQLFPAQHIICREGDPGESFYIILTGSVEVFSQRTETYIASLHEGEFFGEMSLLLGIPRSATVRTLEDSTLFVIGHNDLQKLLMEHKALADQIAQQLAERQRVLQDMGLFSQFGLDETPFVGIRRRLQTLFGI